MNTTFDIRVELCDLSGTVLADLNDDAAGFELVSSTMPDDVWRPRIATSPVVDGEFETGATLAADRLECIVRIKGDTWAQVEGRRLALRAHWADRPAFLVRVYREGVAFTYRARRPNVSGSVESIDLANLRRVVLLTFPVQPNPTVTGV